MIHHHIIRSSRSGFLLQEANRPKARHTPLNPAVLLLPPLKMDGYGSWDTMDLHQIEVCPTSLLLCSRLPCCHLRPASTACAKENCEGVTLWGWGFDIPSSPSLLRLSLQHATPGPLVPASALSTIFEVCSVGKGLQCEAIRLTPCLHH
jgi:hypothetical protein